MVGLFGDTSTNYLILIQVFRARLAGTLSLQEMCNAAAFENRPYPGRRNKKLAHCMK
jgi:hypothetical protein